MGYYDEISEGYDALHGEEQLKKAKIIKAKLALKKTSTLLDVGCGPAAYLDIFGCEATGIDPSAGLLAQYQGKKRVIEGKAEALPFNDRSFDAVISLTAIHNFDDIKKGLEEIARVGKDRFAFSVLKRSKKLTEIEKTIRKLFSVNETIDEGLDIIFFCTKKI